MNDYPKKYRKYKQKYLNSKKIMNGGDLLFVKNYPSGFSIANKQIKDGVVTYKKIDRSTTAITFDINEMYEIELFFNLMLPNLTINGIKSKFDIAFNSYYLSHGTYGTTIDIGNFIVKIMKRTLPAEIHNMIILDDKVRNMCRLYGFFTANDEMRKQCIPKELREEHDYKGNHSIQLYNTIFHMYFQHNSKPDILALNSFTMEYDEKQIRPDSYGTMSIIILEKGFSDSENFRKQFKLQNTIEKLLSFINTPKNVFVSRGFTDVNVNLIKLLYVCKFTQNIFNALYDLNITQKLLHRDMKLDNTIMIHEHSHFIPRFKIIDLGLITSIENRLAPFDGIIVDTRYYVRSIVGEPPEFVGLHLVLTGTRDRHVREYYCSIFYDLYCLFIMISDLLGLTTIRQNASNPNVFLYNIYDTDFTTVHEIHTLSKPTITNLLFKHFDIFYNSMTTNESRNYCVSLFQLLLILSQIIYIQLKDNKLILFNVVDGKVFQETKMLSDDIYNQFYELANSYVLKLNPIENI